METPAPAPNYHLYLWPDPPDTPPYLCLLCPAKDMTLDDVQAHVETVHQTPAVPSYLVLQPPQSLPSFHGDLPVDTTPTYREAHDADGIPVYHCLYCEQAGPGHFAYDVALFQMHMIQRHDGRMVKAEGEPAPAPAEDDDEEEEPSPLIPDADDDVPDPVPHPPPPPPPPAHADATTEAEVAP